MTRTWRLRRGAVLASVLAVLLPVQAWARGPSFADMVIVEPYLGVFGGVHLPERDWDLGVDTVARQPLPQMSADVGLRLGLQLSPRWAVELAGAALPLKTDTSGKSQVFRWDVDVLAQFLATRWTPFAVAGVGIYQSTGGALGRDIDPQVHLGLGVRGLLLRWLAVRAEVRELSTDGFDRANAWNLSATAGLDVYLARRAPPPPPDRDDDGILDGEDQCPDAAGGAATAGCPDRDGDGVADGQDACVDVPGTEATRGCPDRDGDRIADGDDRCPDLPGAPTMSGCPDRDGDGIQDSDDKCPGLAGTANRKGCPDRDGDGILDPDDQCPDIAGVREAGGCLPKAVEKFAGVIQGILFETGKSTILKSSFKTLDAVLPVLAQYPSLRLRIEGHTDNVGKPDENLKLSDERASAVKAYFVSKGVDAKRLETLGVGDTRPVADNGTDAGKARNRRIEFAVIGE